MSQAAELDRRMGDLIRLGTIQTVDLLAARCTVLVSQGSEETDDSDTGDLVSGSLPWLAARAGNVGVWNPPSVGEQVLLLCPEGDIAGGVILTGVPCTAFPAPSSDAHPLVKFPDGSVISYDFDAHVLTVSLGEGAKIALTAPGGASITADVTITGTLAVIGDISATGAIAAAGDIKAAGVSLSSHVHFGVQSGSSLSGKPQ